MIYSRTTIDKQMFKLVLNYKYPLKSGNRFQPFPIWDDSSVYRMLNIVNTTSIEEIKLYIGVVQVKPQVNQFVGGHIDLLVRDNYNVAEFDYGCGPSSNPVLDIGVYGDDEDCTYKEANDEFDEDVDDESNGDADVQANGHVSSFQIFNQVLENEQGIYVSTHAASCDVLNNPDVEEQYELFPVHYHLPPTPQFEHVENLGNVISTGWTPWVQHTTNYSSGEFVVGQVFNSKSDLQEAIKIYSIKAHQEFVVVASSKKLLVLRCKKAEECQCLWKLRVMVVKDTCLFVINKYKGPHTCVNPCLNQDHHQLDSNLVAARGSNRAGRAGLGRANSGLGQNRAGPKLARFFRAKILTAQPTLKTGPVGLNSLFKAKKNSGGSGRAGPYRAGPYWAWPNLARFFLGQ